MKRILLLILTLFCLVETASAKASLTSHYNEVPGSYNFWLYLPDNYDQTQGRTPLIVFLHGASLCGNNLNNVKRYGLIDAVEEGRKVDAIVVAPQCPGGGWKPEKVHAIVEWVKQRYPYNADKLYVVGMSLGGYGTIDYCSTYPDEVAAGIGMCGGATVSASRQQNLAQMPFWLIHGTADRAVSINESKKVEANVLNAPEGGKRLRTTWLQGGNHGAPARVFYHKDMYTWLFSHSLADYDRVVNRDIDFTLASLRGAYNSMPRGMVAVNNNSVGTVKKFTDADFDTDQFENITYDDIDFDAADFMPAGFDDGGGSDNEVNAARSVLKSASQRKVEQASVRQPQRTERKAEKREKSTRASKSVSVKSGDTLDRIARKNGTTVEKLCKANGISRSSKLQIGQKLKIK